MSEKSCCCAASFPWLSGLFAAPAIVHLIRIIAGWEVIWNGNAVAIKTSWIVFIVCGILSMLFCWLGNKKYKKDAGTSSGCCS